MYERLFFTRFRQSDGFCPKERWCRSWSFVALVGIVALLSGCIVRYVVLGDSPNSVNLPYYAGRAAVVIYSPILDSTRVDSLYLYKRFK